MFARSSLTFVLALGVSGCASSTYRAPDSPHVLLVYGAGVYKNGKKYDGLVDAVSDNPRALEEAREAHSAAVTSTWLYVGGTALGVGGVATLATNHGSSTTIPGLSMLGGAIVTEIVAIVVASHAGPHELNAVNIYNDDVDAKMFVRRPAPSPTGTPAMPPADSH